MILVCKNYELLMQVILNSGRLSSKYLTSQLLTLSRAMAMMDSTMRIVNFLLVLMAAFGTWQVAICTSLYGNVTDRLSLIAFKEAISLLNELKKFF